MSKLLLLALGGGIAALLLATGVFDRSMEPLPRGEAASAARALEVLEGDAPRLLGRPGVPQPPHACDDRACPRCAPTAQSDEEAPLTGVVLDDETGEPVTSAVVAFGFSSPFPDPTIGTT
jgi:hypothetical protein